MSWVTIRLAKTSDGVQLTVNEQLCCSSLDVKEKPVAKWLKYSIHMVGDRTLVAKFSDK